MPASTMFSKFKGGNTAPQNPVDTNPITQYFEIGKQQACAGPELCWKIHDAYRKSDGKVRIDIFFLFVINEMRKEAIRIQQQVNRQK